MMPTDLIHTSDEPGPDSHVEQLLGEMVSCSSGADGLLLVACLEGCVAFTIVVEQRGKQVRRRAVVDAHVPDFTYLFRNPLAGHTFLRTPHARWR
jgi:hypothetical protein